MTDKNLTEEDIDEVEDWAESNSIEMPKRDFLKGIGVAGAAATTGGYAISNDTVTQDAHAFPAILPLAGAAASKIGLGGVAGKGVVIGGAAAAGAGITRYGSSTVDRVWGYFSDDDNSSALDTEDTLQSAHIAMAAAGRNIRQYEDRVLAGSRDAKKLSYNKSIQEGLVAGLEAHDAGASQNQAVSEAEQAVVEYYTRIQDIQIEDMQATMFRNAGLYDMVELQNEYDETLISTSDSSMDTLRLFSNYNNFIDHMTEEGDLTEDDITDKVGSDENGFVTYEIQDIAGEIYQMNTLIGISGNFDEYRVIIPKSSSEAVESDARAVYFKDREDDILEILDLRKWRNLWDDTETQASQATDLCTAAVNDAINAGIDTQTILQVFNSIELDAEAQDENIQNLQTAFANIWGDTQEDPANTGFDFSGTGEDGAVKIENAQGEEVEIPKEQFENSNIAFTDDDHPDQLDVGDEITSDGETYVMTENGEMVKVADGENVEVERNTELQEDEDGNLTREDRDEATGINDTDLQTDDIDRVQDTGNVLQSNQDYHSELIDLLENQGSGGIIGSDDTFIQVLLAGGVLGAIYYLLQDDEPPRDSRGRFDSNGNNRNNRRY